MNRFDMEPAWAAALAGAVVAAYLYGWFWSQRPEPQNTAVHLPVSQEWMTASHPAFASSWPMQVSRGKESSARPSISLRSSVHPIIGMEPVRGWLTPGRGAEALPVNFDVGGP